MTSSFLKKLFPAAIWATRPDVGEGASGIGGGAYWMTAAHNDAILDAGATRLLPAGGWRALPTCHSLRPNQHDVKHCQGVASAMARLTMRRPRDTAAQRTSPA